MITSLTFSEWLEKHTGILLIMMLSILVLGSGLGLRDPWPADEPRFALIVRDMVASGNWLIPMRGGEIYPDKPPLFFWLMGCFLIITGSLKIAFLLPSLFASMAVLMLTFDLARRLWSQEIALYATTLLLLTLQFVLQAKYAQIDALLSFWTTLGIYGFIRYLLLNASIRWLFIGFAACGFGVITKGVGVLPLLVFIPYGFALWKKWVAPRNTSWFAWAAGILIMLAPILMWLGPMWWYVENSADVAMYAYRDDILFRQTVTRYANSWGHIKPAWYFLTQIPILWMPLSLILPWLIPLWFRQLKDKQTSYFLLLGFGVLTLIFFSLSPGKRGVYMLPALPAFIIAAAPLLPQLIKKVAINRTAFTVTILLSIILLAIGIYFSLNESELIKSIDSQAVYYLCIALITFSIISMIVAIWMKISHGAYALGGFILSFWLFISWYASPLIDSSRSGKDFIKRVDAELSISDELAIIDYREQHLLQANRMITHFGYGRSSKEQIQDAITWLKSNSNRHVLVRENSAKDCFGDSGKVITYANRTNWLLIPNTADIYCEGSANPYYIDYQYR